MPRNGPRYVPGARVPAKAHHITAQAACHRRYGANTETMFISGTVISVGAAPSSSNRRTMNLVTADYKLAGGTIKRRQLNSRGVKLAEAESVRDETNELVTTLGITNVKPINEATEVGAPSIARVSTQEMHVGA